MNKRIKSLLVAGDELHPLGDWWDDSFRLPEFKFYTTGESGEKHPMHAVGRYLICGIHGDALTAPLNITGSSKAECQSLSERWHASFEGNLAKTLQTVLPMGSSGSERAFVLMKRCIAATMVRRAWQLAPDLMPFTVCLLLDSHPSQTNDWLRQVDKTDLDLMPELELYPSVRVEVAVAAALNVDEAVRKESLAKSFQPVSPDLSTAVETASPISLAL